MLSLIRYHLSYNQFCGKILVQILSALNEVSSFCLRSVLTVVFKWRDMQVSALS